MKNKLKAELKDLAHKILNDDKETSASELKEKAKILYERLTILSFTEENLALSIAETPVEKEKAPEKQEIKNEVPAEKKAAPFVKSPEPVVQQQEKDEYLPDGTEYNEGEAITEPNTEKIKDIVAQMPPETQSMDFMVNNIITKNQTPPREQKAQNGEKRDFRDIGVDYDNLPNFEPVKKQEKERPKSLNDRLKKGFNIGLNERLAFIRHLFDGKTADYNRVISQLSTFDSQEEAVKFIQLVVKPDYKNWQGKEEFENKFMELVENKFSH